MAEVVLPPEVAAAAFALLTAAVGLLLAQVIRLRSEVRDDARVFRSALSALRDRIRELDDRSDALEDALESVERTAAAGGRDDTPDGLQTRTGPDEGSTATPAPGRDAAGGADRPLDGVAPAADGEGPGEATDPAGTGPEDGDGPTSTSDATATGDGERGREPPEPEWSRERVEELYAAWCDRAQEPDPSGAIEVTAMQYGGQESADALSHPQTLLKDASGTSDFVRFSPSGEDRGLLLPHPDVQYNRNTHGEFFPDADRSVFADPSNLTRLEPVEIRRRDDGRWERVDA